MADFGLSQFGWNPVQSFRFMLDALDCHGRGDIFDQLLKSKGKYSKTIVKKCIGVYRHHLPKLRLYDEAEKVLTTLSDKPLYIVTDGHKIVQEIKVRALGLFDVFRHVFITHRYGIKNAKPSTFCFKKIREREGVPWEDMVYIGDNPAKDFVNLNPLRVCTVRVLTGMHSKARAKPGFEARYTIDDLGSFLELLESMEKERG